MSIASQVSQSEQVHRVPVPRCWLGAPHGQRPGLPHAGHRQFQIAPSGSNGPMEGPIWAQHQAGDVSGKTAFWIGKTQHKRCRSSSKTCSSSRSCGHLRSLLIQIIQIHLASKNRTLLSFTICLSHLQCSLIDKLVTLKSIVYSHNKPNSSSGTFS